MAEPLAGQAAKAIIHGHGGILRPGLVRQLLPGLVRRLAGIPRTLTGKRMEVPVTRALLDPTAALPGEPGSLAGFRVLGRQRAATAAARENSPRAT